MRSVNRRGASATFSTRCGAWSPARVPIIRLALRRGACDSEYVRRLAALVLVVTVALSVMVLGAAQDPPASSPQADNATPQADAGPPPPPPFDEWMAGLLAEARARGFSDDILAETLGDVTPVQRVIQNDRSQAELTPGFNRYLAGRITTKVVRQGRELGQQHRALLRRIADQYGVQPRFLLAIWGIESRYGRATGRVPIFQALATLAWEPRRADFFRRELFDALT